VHRQQHLLLDGLQGSDERSAELQLLRQGLQRRRLLLQRHLHAGFEQRLQQVRRRLRQRPDLLRVLGIGAELQRRLLVLVTLRLHQ
jgi:hypothetical protein